MKKIVSLLLAILMIGLSVPVYAEEATPWYIHIFHMSEAFDITSSGIALVTADMALRSGAYGTIAAKIQKETTSGWSTVKTFRATDDDAPYLEGTTKLTSKGTYKCVYVFTVYDDMDFIIEQESFESKEIVYK